MDDLRTLLHDATPEPPVEVSLDEVSRLATARRRRLFVVPAAAAAIVGVAVVLALLPGLGSESGTTAAGDGYVTTKFGTLHVRHPASWRSVPAGFVTDLVAVLGYLTNEKVQRQCTRGSGCGLPADAMTSAMAMEPGGVLVSVTERTGRSAFSVTPNAVVAGEPASLHSGTPRGCPEGATRYTTVGVRDLSIVACFGPDSATAQRQFATMIDSAYFHSRPPKDLGVVTGSLHVVGGPYPGIDRGVQGTVRLTGANGHHRSVTTDAQGTFAVALPAGRYTVRGGPSWRPNCPGNPVTVTAGTVVHARVQCDIL